MSVNPRKMLMESRWISVQLEQLTDRGLALQGFTTAQANVLLYILHHVDHGTSLTAMHREFGYSMPSLCSILKRLRQNGHVRVEPCPGDERRKLLFPTGQAEALGPFLEEGLSSSFRRVYRGFSEEELQELDRLQKKMVENLGVPGGTSHPCQEA